MIDGPSQSAGSTWPGVLVCADYAEGFEVGTSLAKAGYTSLKVYNNLGQGALHGVCDAAREHGATVVGHCPNSMTFEEAARTGMSGFEHLENVETGHLQPEYATSMQSLRGRAAALGAARSAIEGLKLRIDGINWMAVDRMADELASLHVSVCPTLIVYRMMFQSPEVAAEDRNLQYVPAEQIDGWQPRNDFRLRPLVPVWPEIVELSRHRLEMYLEVVRILHSRGVLIMAGSDAPNPYLVPGFALQQELALLVHAGLSPFQAIRCATAATGSLLGDARAGAIEVGARADLVILDGDPTESLGALRRPHMVIHGGRVYRRDALNRLLRHRPTRS